MRAVILAAGAGLALSACGPKADSDNAVATSDNLAAEAIIANDTTAIDAATGDAANMAADVDYSVNATNDDDRDVAASGRTSARRQPSSPADETTETNDAAADVPADANGA